MNSIKTITIFRKNLLALLNQDEQSSMRNLSTSIGASDSYVQKIITSDANPSLDKIDSISEFFDVNSWELFYDAENDERENLATIQLLNRMPSAMLPVIKHYIEYLQQESPSEDES
ncbi:MAG: hypothetical protein LUE19_03175 [Clostridiales bacterium]|nr:hypothetical protein [Clostridiales bacterium]